MRKMERDVVACTGTPSRAHSSSLLPLLLLPSYLCTTRLRHINFAHVTQIDELKGGMAHINFFGSDHAVGNVRTANLAAFDVSLWYACCLRHTMRE